VVASDLFHAKYFALITGVTQMLAAFGAMMGQTPVSLMVKHLGWRETMFALSAAGVLLAIVLWLVMNYERSCKHINDQNFATPRIKNDLKEILSSPQTWVIGLYAMLLWAPMSGFASLWGVEFLSRADGLSPTSAAFYCSLMWLGLALFSPIIGIVATKIKNIWLCLLLAAFVGSVSFGLILNFSLSPILLGLCLLLAGAACSGQSLSFALIKENNRDSVKATALAINNMAVVISGAIFQPLIGKLISRNDIVGVTSVHTLADYKTGLSVIFVAFSLGTIVCFGFIREKKKR
jgi:predicted MFS family arabinose efflux permease